jgi:D-alanyl-D-alanine dipeptidase
MGFPMRPGLTLAPLLLAALAAPAQARGLPQTGTPKGFVYLRDVDETVAQDIRYAGADNFTGRPLPGYNASECVLRGDVARALARVEADLAKRNLGLKVYDCYRPARAVRAMWRWSQDAKSDGNRRFYPRVPKRELFTLGYIAAHSAHSTGTAVDLTLVARPAAPGAPSSAAAANAPCTAPAAQRASDNSLDNALDMGTGFDCLDTMSRTHSGAISPEQARRRDLLNAAMRAHGFHNYFREWWHFSYGAHPAREYDFPIVPRASP